MDRYFRLARHWASFGPAFVACPYIFTDVLEMVVGTVMQDIVQPIVLHYHFRIPYIEVKSKVEGSQMEGGMGIPGYWIWEGVLGLG